DTLSDPMARKPVQEPEFLTDTARALHQLRDPVAGDPEGELLLIESTAKTLKISMPDLARRAGLSRTTMWRLMNRRPTGAEVWSRVWRVLDEEWMARLDADEESTPTKQLARWDSLGRRLLAYSPERFHELMKNTASMLQGLETLATMVEGWEQ